MGLVQFTWQSYYDALIFDLLQIISGKTKPFSYPFVPRRLFSLSPSQKLWQIKASLCLRGTKVRVRYYYSQGLHKHALTHTDRGYRPGRRLCEPEKKEKEAHVASVIISRGNHNSVHTTEECKNKRAIQQQ